MFSQISIGRFEAVIHFAGLKAVGESVAKPLLYYNNNLMSTINLLDVMSKNNCKNVSTFANEWQELYFILFKRMIISENIASCEKHNYWIVTLGYLF